MGKAYLLTSSGSLDGTDPTPAVHDAAWTFEGELDADEAGRFVTGIDDLDGDGLAEVAIAAPRADHTAEEAGVVYVVTSSTIPVLAGTPQTLSLADADVLLHGEAAGDTAGHSILTAGDFDGDGKGDLTLGSMFNDAGGRDAARAYFVTGDTLSSTSGSVDLADVDHKLSGEAPDDRLASTAGDLDGDGLDDLLVYSFENDEAAEAAGKTDLFLAAGLGATSTQSMADADATLVGERPGDDSGQTAAGVSDLNHDDCNDLLVGAYRSDVGGEDAGMVYILRSNL